MGGATDFMNAAGELLGAAALARHGRRTALICGAECVSYADLASRVSRAASCYAEAGVAPGERVLLLLRDTPDYAAAWLGAVWRGAVPIGLNNKLADDDLGFIATDSGARMLVTEPALARDIGLPVMQAAELRSAREGMQPALGSVQRPAFWLYSSGTTGRPKGIIHAHRSMQAAGQAQREVIGLAADDCVLATSKLFFAYALENGFLGPLSLGASVVLNPDWAETDSICELAARHAPSAFFSVPSFYRKLLALPRERLAAFRSVRRFVAAGERLPAQLVDAWRAATGSEILSIYGMSETFCVAMLTRPGTSTGVHTGAPIAGVEARIIDAGGAPVADGETGVLWVRHPALALGYANLAQRTREQFVDGWFCTLDMFVRDASGCYAHQGRADELIKVAGQWVRPSVVEEAAMAATAVADAACVPVPDADGLERLALFVASAGDAAAAMAAASEACERLLARHERPKWIRTLAELPRTATGKVQRFRLREMLEREFAGKD
jgi:benzoate-CoA ligase